MIESIISVCPKQCQGGFLAYWNDNPLYPSDPSAMFRRAIAVLLTIDHEIYVCPIDMTQGEPDYSNIIFYPHTQQQFGTRSTGALFYKGCYFSICSGNFFGSYQITEDYIKNQAFPTIRAYTKYLCHGQSS